MKILLLCDFFSNYAGNFIPSLQNLESHLSERGHETYYIFSTRNPSKDFFNWEKPFAETHKVKLMDFTKLSLINKVADFIKINNIDVVYGHFLGSFLLSQIKKNTPKSVKFYEHIHSAPFGNKKTFKAFLKRLRNFIFLEKIPKICNSNAIVKMTRYVYPCCSIDVCQNGIFLDRLTKNAFIRQKEFKVLLFGYNYYIKGVDVAIEALLKFNSKHSIMKLDIVFGDNLAKNTNIIIEKYGKIPENVFILEPIQNVSKLYKEHSVYLNASRSEGFSYANMESYYCGTMCVQSNIPANLEQNLPGTIYFKSGNSDSLLEALEKAYSIKDTYVNDLKHIEENKNIDIWSKTILKIIKL